MEASTTTTIGHFIPSNVSHSRYYKDYDSAIDYATFLVRTYYCAKAYIYAQGALFYSTPYKGSDNYIAAVEWR